MGIVGLLTLGPSLSYLLLWWLARFYKLDDKMMQTIQRELSMRQQQGHSETHLPLNAVPKRPEEMRNMTPSEYQNLSYAPIIPTRISCA